MTVPNGRESYEYPTPFRLGKTAALLIFIFGVIELPLALIQLLSFASTPIPQSLWNPGSLIVVSLASILLGGIGLNTFPVVKVQDDGLAVEVLLCAHRFIPWSDVLEVHRGTYSLKQMSYAIVVVRSGLTIWHTIHAVILGYRGKQVFGIHEYIQNYLDLLRIIELATLHSPSGDHSEHEA